MIEQNSAAGDMSLFEIADCYILQKNWAQAAIEFEALLNGYPQSELRPIVLYRLADAWLLSNQSQKARTGFEQVVNEYPEQPLSQEAGFRLAEMLEEQEHLQEALKAFSMLTAYPRQDLLKQKILNLKQRMARKKKVL
jgi:TolA-binding protein